MPAPLASHLSRTLRAFQVYGANTSVGKTVFATLLARASAHHFPAEPVFYLKPISTGAPADADDTHVARFAGPAGVRAECLHQYADPVSPHLVALSPPSDASLLEAIRGRMAAHAGQPATLLVETAGGVHSPALTGTSQADLYRPLRLPVLLVADPRLGGISASVAAFEALHIRGYDVEGVCVFGDAYYRNDAYLKEYFAGHGIATLVLPPPPVRRGAAEEEEEEAAEDVRAMGEYYDTQCAGEEVAGMLRGLRSRHGQRIDRLQRMPREALARIWYPFTQHRGLRAGDIAAIDSAHGDFFQTCTGGGEDAVLGATLDGSASWWTQGLGHANPALMLAAAHAAGRYGHVMFANAVHEPALELARELLAALPNARLARVFYSDNGSTGCEVAVKMALRAARERYGWARGEGPEEAGVLGLCGSYHGDTIGAMDCAEPGVYNGQVDWYRGRGFWFDFPRVAMKRGRWVVEVPAALREHLGPDVEMETLGAVFDLGRRADSDLGRRCRAYILSTLERLTQAEGRRFGALIIEPLVLGAGGMLLCDPLFQSILVSVVRSHPALFSPGAAAPADPKAWSGLPVVFDEVFTGMYRLGRLSAASFLQAEADISVHAKLLTGGLLPLCATLASEAVFAAFLGGDKKDALLHGHSYTAHAVGCSVARESVKTLMRLEASGAWDGARRDWAGESAGGGGEGEGEGAGAVWSVWGREFVARVSRIEGVVEGVWALGSVLAVTLRAGDDGAGYSSGAAGGFLQRMGGRGARGWNVHARALGNVVYVMLGQTTGPETVVRVQAEILEALEA